MFVRYLCLLFLVRFSFICRVAGSRRTVDMVLCGLRAAVLGWLCHAICWDVGCKLLYPLTHSLRSSNVCVCLLRGRNCMPCQIFFRHSLLNYLLLLPLYFYTNIVNAFCVRDARCASRIAFHWLRTTRKCIDETQIS